MDCIGCGEEIDPRRVQLKGVAADKCTECQEAEEKAEARRSHRKYPTLQPKVAARVQAQQANQP